MISTDLLLLLEGLLGHAIVLVLLIIVDLDELSNSIEDIAVKLALLLFR